MKAVLQTIWILVIILLIENIRCQDGMNNGDVMRYQQIAANDGQIETITSYSTNIIQRDPSSQSISSVSVQYRMSDDGNKNDEFNRADRGRTRKVYHIKNPFQQVEETPKGEANTGSDTQDSGSAASNQYAAMQYSLPPDDFLQQMRAENQYYQQQQQLSTSTPNLGYTTTPQPQYQYSTMTAQNYDNNNNQQSNQIQIEPKASHSQSYLSNSNYQYNAQNGFSLDNAQSTPSPVTSFLSTSLPNNQYVGTPSNTYVSSSSPIYLSSPTNLQQYVSSPLSPMQVSSPTYGNRVTSTLGSNSINYDNDPNKKIQIDHYDNSANGVRYHVNMQQYQNEYPSSTSAPSSSPYSDPMRESWQNTMNAGINALSKSLQEVSLSQYQNYAYNNNNNNNNQQDTRIDSTMDSVSSDTHRIGTLSPANNMYLNYMQSDYNQALNNLKSRPRELQQESPQQDLYSNGDYGWKLTGKKPLISHDNYPANYPKYAGINSQSENGAVSQMNFHLDTSKVYNYDQNAKTVSENIEAQEFAKAAAKAQENMKQQQLYGNNFPNSFVNNNQNPQSSNGNGFYDNEKQKNKYPTGLSFNSYSYSTPQPDLITAAPYYYGNSNDNNADNKPKQPFDHAKALKNIVPIDVSNVVQNSEAQLKALANLDGNNRFSLPNPGKDQSDQNLKQYYRPIADAYYKDKNTLYGFNLKTKPEDFLTAENFKQLESNAPYLGKQQQTQDGNINPMGFSAGSQTVTYTPQVTSSFPENVQSFVNFQQQGLSRPQNQMTADIANLLKLNDSPYRITQGFTSDALKLQNNNFDQTGIPTPLPMRLNQNIGSHQLDVTSNLLSKLLMNKQPSLSVNRPEIESLSTINGYKVANPYNVDLKLVAEMLKGKPTVDDSHLLSLKDQLKAPIKIDLSQLQMLLRNENAGLASINDGLSSLSSPYIDIYNSGRFPYQGVKYSRSQEEEESIIPIADATNSHPIGAVMDQDDAESDSDVGLEPDTSAQADESFVVTYDEDRAKKPVKSVPKGRDRHRHANALLSGRHSYQRKYPVGEPYPLLRPPPPQTRNRGVQTKRDKYNRQRRVTKPKVFRILKSEPMYDSDADNDSIDTAVPILLRPPPPEAEDKSDS